LNALHAAPKKAEGDEEEDYGDEADDAEQPDNEPPAFASDQTANLIPGVTDKLNIVSKPPEKSPYTKLFNVSHHTFNSLAYRREIQDCPQSSCTSKGERGKEGS
jgi:hypothetical protein